MSRHFHKVASSVPIFALSFLHIFFSVFISLPAFASEEAVTQAEFTNGEYIPVRPISDHSPSDSENFKQESVIQQAVKEQILTPSSPLTPAEPVSNQMTSDMIVQSELQSLESSIFTSVMQASQSLPQEENFLTRTSNGVYQMEFDDYLKALLRDLLPASFPRPGNTDSA